MQVKNGGRVYYNSSFKRLLFSLCFCMFCIIDQRVRTGNGPEGWLETFRDLTGVVIAVIIMSHYKIEDFRRWKFPYFVWSVIGAGGCVAAFYWGMKNQMCLKDWFVVLLDIFLYGYIAIHTFISVVMEKNIPKFNRAFACLWLATFIVMISAQSSYKWPFCYLVMFGCFYLTNYNAKEQEDLFQGILNGIIGGFFVLQGLCFVFRPYDEVRYAGMYANPNINALFYLEVLAAVLTKIIYITKSGERKWLRCFFWLEAGVVLSFLFLTIGRTAWMTAALMVILFLWFLKKVLGRKNIFKEGFVLLLCMCLTFPFCFGAARYLPPFFHHPIWFAGEWSTERVHSWDPWDSEKYVELDEFMEAAVGRVAGSIEDFLKHSPFLLHTDAAEAVTDEIKTFVNQETLLTDEEGSDSVLVRYTIYKHYIERLKLWGQPVEEQGFQLTETYFVPHAHNIYLQYGTDFGIIAMILFAIVSFWAVFLLRKKFVTNMNEQYAGYLLFSIIPILYGIFECSWGTGTLGILMMFVAWRKAGLRSEV